MKRDDPVVVCSKHVDFLLVRSLNRSRCCCYGWTGAPVGGDGCNVDHIAVLSTYCLSISYLWLSTIKPSWFRRCTGMSCLLPFGFIQRMIERTSSLLAGCALSRERAALPVSSIRLYVVRKILRIDHFDLTSSCFQPPNNHSQIPNPNPKSNKALDSFIPSKQICLLLPP